MLKQLHTEAEVLDLSSFQTKSFIHSVGSKVPGKVDLALVLSDLPPVWVCGSPDIVSSKAVAPASGEASRCPGVGACSLFYQSCCDISSFYSPASAFSASFRLALPILVSIFFCNLHQNNSYSHRIFFGSQLKSCNSFLSNKWKVFGSWAPGSGCWMELTDLPYLCVSVSVVSPHRDAASCERKQPSREAETPKWSWKLI